eukprot:scaffold71182_cov36-Phaeocystis_antarctica.AAC.1
MPHTQQTAAGYLCAKHPYCPLTTPYHTPLPPYLSRTIPYYTLLYIPYYTLLLRSSTRRPRSSSATTRSSGCAISSRRRTLTRWARVRARARVRVGVGVRVKVRVTLFAEEDLNKVDLAAPNPQPEP